MAITEQSRHELYRHLIETMGEKRAATLMAHLPPVGWADVATKQDIDHLRETMALRFETITRRFEGVEASIAALAERFDGIEASLRHMDERLRHMDDKLSKQFFAGLGFTLSFRRPARGGSAPGLIAEVSRRGATRARRRIAEGKSGPARGPGDLASLLASGATWQVN
ncbi:MAG: hypothetical protein M3394_07010 [Actinomycetota bacterium]|nr:hypothetical protein [Actinomycetota bacterium]